MSSLSRQDQFAIFYNMGTAEALDVVVNLNDLTDSIVLDTDTISFSGYVCDNERVTFSWQPGSSDIGIHILEIEAEALENEPDTNDNSTRVVFQILPRDYARTVLGDPWDMTEATSSIPTWYTNDIESLTSSWNSSAYTDSISGMFEGVLNNPSSPNSLYLNIGSDLSTRINADKYFNFSICRKSRSKFGNKTSLARLAGH